MSPKRTNARQYLLLLVIYGVIAAELSARAPQNFRVLLYTSPDRYHNQALPTAVSQFEKLAARHFFELKWTQLPSDLSTEVLKDFHVVVFLFSNGRELQGNHIEALKAHLRAGRGFVGVHSTSVDSKQDAWFKRLVGRTFIGHPEKQTAILEPRERMPATYHLPDRWLWTDEWYEFGDPLVPSLRVVLAVDETSYVPLEHKDEGGRTVRGMGADHPVAWYHGFEGGRSFYTALGHDESYYEDPAFLQHLYGGIYWAATGVGTPGNLSDAAPTSHGR